VKIGKTSTLLSDLVPLCPNCHRAVHYAYSDYLKKMSKDDFDDAKEAIYCYENAKKQYMLSK
jgi:predicted HNH restriction endonuclease